MFEMLFGIGCETKILEACDWNEERAAEVSEFLSSAIKKSQAKSPSDMIIFLENSLGEIATDKEIVALSEIIKESVDNIYFLLMNDNNYEN